MLVAGKCETCGIESETIDPMHGVCLACYNDMLDEMNYDLELTASAEYDEWVEAHELEYWQKEGN